MNTEDSDDKDLPEDNQKGLTNWANEPDLLTLKRDLEAAKPAHDTQQARIDHWKDLMFVRGKAAPKRVKGRSNIQPKLIRRQGEWRYSALTEPFLGSQKLFSVNPITFEDEKAARQNELLLNWQFRTKINRVKFFDEYVRTAVNEGTCIVRLGWERGYKMVKEMVPIWNHFQIQTEEEMMPLQQALELKLINPREYEENVDPALKAAVDYFQESGIPTVAIQAGEEEIEKEEITVNKPTVDVMESNNVIIDPSCGGDIDKAMFVVVSFETCYADLKKQGDRYKNLEKVNWQNSSPMSQPDHITTTPEEYNFSDKARRKVVAYEYWGYFDIHNTGELVPFVATWVGDVCIRMEESPFPDGKVPFVVVPYMPIKGSLYGEPDAELIEDNQAVSGAVMRGVIDLLGRSANSQQGFAKGMLDPLNRRRFDNGEDYEYNPGTDPRIGLIEHKYPDIPQSALAMLNLQNNEAESIVGVKAFSGGLSSDTYGKVATGIRGVLDAASKREMAILRRLAKGLIDIAYKISAMNSVFLSDVEVVRVTNSEYIAVTREDLKGNFDLETDISTAEVDNAQSQDLGFMLQTMGPNMDSSISTMILADIARLKRMPVLENKLLNWKPQPDPIAEELRQLEVEEKKAKIAELHSRIAMNHANAGNAEVKAATGAAEAQRDASGESHARAMEKQQGQARGNQELEVTKALLKPRKLGEDFPDIDAAIGYNSISGTI